MPDYSIEIPNKRLTAYRVVTGIVMFMNVIIAFTAPDNGEKWKHSSFIVIVVLNLLGVADIYLARNRRKTFSIALFFSAVIWLITAHYLIGALMTVFAFMSLRTLNDLVIEFSDEGILYPSFPKKLFTWSEVSFVKLKDDILTIDLKSNQLFQFRLMPEASEKIKEGEFNEYCKAKMAMDDRPLTTSV